MRDDSTLLFGPRTGRLALVPDDDRPHVLIVEDEDTIRESLADLFDGTAIVHAAATLGEAVRALHERTFDLVVTDLQLGVKRDAGFQVMALGALLSADASIVVLTAFPDAAARAAAGRLGAAHFLTKPVDLEALARIAAAAGIRTAADAMTGGPMTGGPMT